MSGMDKATDQFSATSTPKPQGSSDSGLSRVASSSDAPQAPAPQPQGPTPVHVSSQDPVMTASTDLPNNQSTSSDAPLLDKVEEPKNYAPQPNLEEGLKPRISVIGVGGAGCNAINNMIKSELVGVDFYVANTDAQALEQAQAQTKIQLGLEATHGLGAGSHPEMGKASAEESIRDVLEKVGGSHMLFVTAGMGGGTGTGAAPVIAKAAREQGILTVGVVTKPFHFEGAKRMRVADAGIEELQKYVDTLIVIPNQNLFRVANEKTTFVDAFKMADEVLYSGVRSVTDLMMKPGLINLDFADVKAVMGEMMGKAMMGTGEAEGDGRAIDAAEAAISSPLLDDVSMKGAKAVLINITGGMDMTLFEADEAANRIREEVDPNAHIIFGSTFDESLEGKIRVSCVATGIDAHSVVAASVSQPSSRTERREQPQTTAQPQPQVEESQASASFGSAPQESMTNPAMPEPTFKEPHVSSVQEELGVSFAGDLEEDENSQPEAQESTYDIYSSLRSDMRQSHDQQPEAAPTGPSLQDASPSAAATPTEAHQPQDQENVQSTGSFINREQPQQAAPEPQIPEENAGDDSEHRGFFSRLMGRKKTSAKLSPAPEKKLSPPPQSSQSQPIQQRQPNLGSQDDLDVPAFLRRKDRH